MSKKQIRILAILTGIALLLGVALAILRYDPREKPLDTLVTIPMEAIDQLCFNYRDQAVNLQLQEDIWQVLLPEDMTLPANQEMVNAILTTLCQIRPQQLLEGQTLDQIPTVTRQATVEILSGSGSNRVKASQQIIVGSMNAITDQLYVQTNDQLYLTDTTLMELLSVTELELLEQFPIPRPENHRSVTVENAFGTLTLSCVGSETGGEDGTWFVKTPDGWTECDQNAAYNFYFLTYDMHWKSTAAVITKETDHSYYGFDDPQAIYTLTYGDETFRLYLGKNLPDNTTYAMCDGNGSTLIYTMDTLLAKWLAEATVSYVLPQ